MSTTTATSHAYGIGLLAVIIGMAAGLGYYQMFYLPEESAKPSVAEHILFPVKQTIIDMILGSASADQVDNFVPKIVNIQLGIDNHVVWNNVDDTAHTVTADEHGLEDGYSGRFGSSGVVLPGESYEFLFTEPNEIPYHCEPHPWMTGELIITKTRF